MKLGVNRIAYQPKDLLPGKEIMLQVFNPKAEIFEIIMTDMGNGMYLKDLNFKYVGPYIYHVYEDGVYKGRKLMRAERNSSVIPYLTELEDV